MTLASRIVRRMPETSLIAFEESGFTRFQFNRRLIAGPPFEPFLDPCIDLAEVGRDTDT